MISDLYAFVVLLTAQSLSDLYFDEVGIAGYLGRFFSGMLYATYLLKCDRTLMLAVSVIDKGFSRMYDNGFAPQGYNISQGAVSQV